MHVLALTVAVTAVGDWHEGAGAFWSFREMLPDCGTLVYRVVNSMF